MNKWISLTSKVPPPNERVIIYTPNLGIFIVRCNEDNASFEYIGYKDGKAIKDTATHWMPLPDVPSDEPKKARCSKCVYELHCSKDKDNERNCPDYKRDAPDGGYYG